MLRHLSAARWMSLCSAVLLAACGGSGGGAGAPTAPPAAPATTLVVSTNALVLSVNNTPASPSLTGNPRIFTITNVGSAVAQSVIYAVSPASPALPSGTTTLSNCVNLAPGASCTITVTPGNTASATPADVSPVPVTLSIGGLNTNILSPTVQVLDHGSVYQGGYVFAIDDTTANTGNVLGKVSALANAAISPGLPWGAAAGGAPWIVDVPATNETSVAACAGLTDGACNTAEIVAAHSAASLTDFAAGACAASTQGSRSDWYLPALCEVGNDVACPVGHANVQTNLIDSRKIPVVGAPITYFWTSTQSNLSMNNANAWRSELDNGARFVTNKTVSLEVSCVRALTP